MNQTKSEEITCNERLKSGKSLKKECENGFNGQVIGIRKVGLPSSSDSLEKTEEDIMDSGEEE